MANLPSMNQYEMVLSGQRGTRYAVNYNRDHLAVSGSTKVVLLAAGALADIALMEPHGYSGTTASDVSEITGLSREDAQGELVLLAQVGALHVDGDVALHFRLPSKVLDPADDSGGQ